MRKSLIAVTLLVGIAFAANAQAAKRVANPDMYDNSRAYTDVTCPEGKVVGFAYFDFKNDSVDAVSVICETRGGRSFIPKSGDWPAKGSSNIQEHRCRKHEKLFGVRYKDRDVRGKHRDAVDGLTVACKNKRTGEVRWTYNPDTKGGRNWTEIWIPRGKKIRGISYKDGGCGGSKSDCVDAVTLLLK